LRQSVGLAIKGRGGFHIVRQRKAMCGQVQGIAPQLAVSRVRHLPEQRDGPTQVPGMRASFQPLGKLAARREQHLHRCERAWHACANAPNGRFKLCQGFGHW
jgi:hypothetical protein